MKSEWKKYLNKYTKEDYNKYMSDKTILNKISSLNTKGFFKPYINKMSYDFIVEYAEIYNDEIIGLILNCDHIYSKEKELTFYLAMKKDSPMPKDKVKNKRISLPDIIDHVSPNENHSQFVRREDLELSKLKLKIILSNMGWDIDDITK